MRVAVWKVVGAAPPNPDGAPVGAGPEGTGPDGFAPDGRAWRVGRAPLGRRVRLGIGMVTASALNPLAPDSCAGGAPDGIGPLIMR